MESVIPAVILIALLLVTASTVAESYVELQEAMYESQRDMLTSVEDRIRTSIAILDGEVDTLGHASVVVANDGSTKLADYDSWDVIIEYDGGGGHHIKHPGYEAAGDKWFEMFDEEVDVIDPGILNPAEQMTIQIQVVPEVDKHSVYQVTVTAPNGVSTSAVLDG